MIAWPTMTAKGATILTAGIVMLAWGGSAAAQSVADFFRGQTISIHIGYAPGGAYDLSARVLARHMGRHIPGQPMVVAKNMPGAGSLKLANYLYNVAPRDGTEFGIFGRTIPLEPLFGKREAQFDALKFTWLGSTSNEVSTCVSWHTSPVKTAADVLQTELVVGAAGASSPSAVFPNLFNAILGTKFKVINGYPSSANSLLAMEKGELSGFCAWGWVAMASTRPDWIRDKKFNVLFQIALQKHPDHQRPPLILDLAKTDEDRQVLELVVAPQSFARPFAAPPGLPQDRADALRKAFDATVTDPEFVKEATKLQLEPELVSAAQLEDILRRLYATPTLIVERAQSALGAQ
jgi:tripartite-type tricarboxylate transporter receptor subunit TctC